MVYGLDRVIEIKEFEVTRTITLIDKQIPLEKAWTFL